MANNSDGIPSTDVKDEPQIEVLGDDVRNAWDRSELAALVFDFEDAEAEGTPS